MKRKIGLSIITSAILVTSVSADILSDKRKAALEALGGGNYSSYYHNKKRNFNNKELEKKVQELEDNSLTVDHPMIKALQDRIIMLENSKSSQSGGLSKNDIKKINNIEKTVKELEKIISKKDMVIDVKRELLKLKTQVDNLKSDNKSTQPLKQSLSKMEKEIKDIKKIQKYQLNKISSIEEDSFDLQDEMETKSERKIKWNGQFSAGYVSEYGDNNQLSSRFGAKGMLIGSQKINDTTGWLVQENLTYADYIPLERSNDQVTNMTFIGRGYVEYNPSDNVKLRIGRDWLRSTIWSDNNFGTGIVNSRDPLYNEKIIPSYQTGLEVLGDIPVKDMLFDYAITLGNGVSSADESDNNKLFNTRLRLEIPYLDFTRLSVSAGMSKETKSDPMLANYYDKMMFSVGLEQKSGNWKWNAQYVYGDYSANKVPDGEDIKRTAANLTVSYDFERITPWLMIDYLDLDKEYNVDLAPIGSPVRDPNTYMLKPQYQGMTEVDSVTRVGFGANYKLNKNLYTHLEQYIGNNKQHSTMITLSLAF